jgi:acetyl-CoA carboxylase biotin carboxylase subunit
MADSHGNVRAFGERECSIQRRHQKVLEEAPSIAVTPEIRRRLCDAAVAAAQSCGYRNAGTVEFLMDDSGEFYFLEMNARLQVEHPVTELVYGVDLVALQIAIANGEALPPQDGPLQPRGWSIEARINSENAYENFTPSLGLVEHVELPMGPGTRFDTMLFDGLDIPPFYDSLLGKLIVWAETRELAVERLRRALDDLLIVGIDTNVPFHLQLLQHPDFRSGAFHTTWLEESFTMPDPLEDDPREQTALIAAAIAASIVGNATPTNTNSSTKWMRATREHSLGLKVQSGGGGWRHGIASS